jgi:hypothetical protein
VLGIGAYAAAAGAQLVPLTDQQMDDWMTAAPPQQQQQQVVDSSSQQRSRWQLPWQAKQQEVQQQPAVTQSDQQQLAAGAEGLADQQEQQQQQQGEPRYHLIAYPAQDNFAGVVYPLDYINKVRRAVVRYGVDTVLLCRRVCLNPSSAGCTACIPGSPPLLSQVRATQAVCLCSWLLPCSSQAHATSSARDRYLVLLDAAAFLPSHPLDLTRHPADFVAASFYKMFGYPTGLGALVLRTELVPQLRKVGVQLMLVWRCNAWAKHSFLCKGSSALDKCSWSCVAQLLCAMQPAFGASPSIHRYFGAV